MPVPRTLYLVIGAIAAPVGVCASVIAPAVGALAGTIAVGLVMLLGAAGALLAADWRADQQSRQAWAEIAPALAEWSLIDREEAEDIQTRYHQPAFADDVLREVFRSDRCLSPQAAVMELPVAPTAFPAAPTQSFPMRTACQAAQGSRSDGENDARSLLGDRPTDQALRASSARPAKRLTFAAGRQRAGEYCAVDGTRVRLAVNAGASWLASDWALAPPRHAAEVVVLSSCRDAQHTRPAEAATETVQVTGTEPPNCRGPPPLDQRRLTRRVVAKAGHAAPSAMVSDVDLVVLDNLGHPVPICAAELDAIETYLGDVLEEVFASSKAGSEAKST